MYGRFYIAHTGLGKKIHSESPKNSARRFVGFRVSGFGFRVSGFGFAPGSAAAPAVSFQLFSFQFSAFLF